ncbi:MAG TPA: HesA/MoeB/ThiF family protein [Hanamia sp.]|nr:HesA/MoeB/ThiF family protein [Hanamia sp.]
MNGNERYRRQITLKGFGENGQHKLAGSKILIAGIGGLGCPALLYLATSGVGCIGIADDDFVALSNLPRQVLFSPEDVGKSKVQVAEKKIKEMNPDVEIISYQDRLTNENALEIISKYDIVLDGTDNFPSKYLINDACVLLNKPLVYGSVSKFEGQVAVFNVTDKKNVKCNYRDLFPQVPDEKILNCAEEGVLGFTTGIIGTMQANETIKLLTGIGEPLINRLLIFNSLNNQSYTIEVTQNKSAYNLPSNEEEFKETNYDWLCIPDKKINVINNKEFREMLDEKEVLFVDVREVDEKPEVNFHHKKIPLSNFQNEIENISENKIVFFCQTGKRSIDAAKMLLDQYGETKKVYSLNGGVLSLQD